ncbi:MAG: DUF4430 domain-containing protein [Pirellulaceae bacterium]|nr:DUF4430 domain-containing protein [Pirellulaceae bacterium]
MRCFVAPPSLVLVLLWTAVWLAAPRTPACGAAEPPDAAAKVVELTIDYGDGVQKRFTQIQRRDEWTVLDLLQAAERHPRGIKLTYRGKGATALLTQIDDRKNEGSGRNWLFYVNGKLADRSFAIVPLADGDQVLWRFEEYRP